MSQHDRNSVDWAIKTSNQLTNLYLLLFFRYEKRHSNPTILQVDRLSSQFLSLIFYMCITFSWQVWSWSKFQSFLRQTACKITSYLQILQRYSYTYFFHGVVCLGPVDDLYGTIILENKDKLTISVHVFKRTSDYKTRVGYNLVKLQITFLRAFQITIWKKSVRYCNLEFSTADHYLKRNSSSSRL